VGDTGARKSFRGGKFHVGGKVKRDFVPLFNKMVVNPLGDVGMMVNVTGNVPFSKIESATAGIYAVDPFHSGESMPNGLRAVDITGGRIAEVHRGRVNAYDGNIAMGGKECVLFGNVFAVNFRMRGLQRKRDIHRRRIVLIGSEGGEAGNHVRCAVEVGLRTVHTESVGMNRFIAVSTLAFRRGEIDVRLGVVVRQCVGGEVACCESGLVGVLGLEIVTKLGMEGIWAGETGVHVELETHEHEIRLLDWTG
jgi:hypothetical protein